MVISFSLSSLSLTGLVQEKEDPAPATSTDIPEETSEGKALGRDLLQLLDSHESYRIDIHSPWSQE